MRANRQCSGAGDTTGGDGNLQLAGPRLASQFTDHPVFCKEDGGEKQVKQESKEKTLRKRILKTLNTGSKSKWIRIQEICFHGLKEPKRFRPAQSETDICSSVTQFHQQQFVIVGRQYPPTPPQSLWGLPSPAAAWLTESPAESPEHTAKQTQRRKGRGRKNEKLYRQTIKNQRSGKYFSLEKLAKDETHQVLILLLSSVCDCDVSPLLPPAGFLLLSPLLYLPVSPPGLSPFFFFGFPPSQSPFLRVG